MDKQEETSVPVPFIYNEEESQSNRLARKAKDAPFMVVGLLGLAGIVAYSFHGIRQRKLPLSVYLIQTRVGAQGFVVACLTCGVAYNMFQEYVYPLIKGTANTEADTSSTTKEDK